MITITATNAKHVGHVPSGTGRRAIDYRMIPSSGQRHGDAPQRGQPAA